MALATSARSPNSCDSSLRYGVSPHPEQAPENSNSGSCTCCCRMLPTLILRRSSSGIFRKNSQFSRSGRRSGGCGAMLIAFSRVSCLFLTGQTSTQMPQPVQSSGATWMLYFRVAHSLSRASVDLKVAGAPSAMRRVEHLDADHRVRANHGALAALDADLGIPHRNLQRDVALLPLGGSGGEGAVGRERADRQLVAAVLVDRAQYVALEIGRAGGESRRNFDLAGGLGRHLSLRGGGPAFRPPPSCFSGRSLRPCVRRCREWIGGSLRSPAPAARLSKWQRSRPAEWYSCGCPCRCRAPPCSRQ